MPAFPSSLLRWTPADFTRADHEGIYVDPAVGAQLLPGAPEGVLVGMGTPRPVAFTEAITSWHAVAPAGTQLEVALRVALDERWTRWWTMGVWSSEPGRRFSVEDQQDDDGYVATDTLVLRQPAQSLQWRVVLRSEQEGRSPLIWGLAVVTSPAGPPPQHDRPRAVAELPVPELSQMDAGVRGKDLCSPAALTMVLHYWHLRTHEPRLAPYAAPDATERLTAPGVHDPVYDGTGNWAFNTAYAASLGLESYVARFDTLAELGRWVAAGIPVIASISFDEGELDNTPAGFVSSSGHLLVVVGFTAEGDVIVNDPRADPRDGSPVRRVYTRDQFKRAWQHRSRGTVYLIYPKGLA